MPRPANRKKALDKLINVYTIVYIMSIYEATVIKTGNSIALRVPKRYAQDADITPGDKVNLKLPQKHRYQNHLKIQQIITKLQAVNGYKSIADPVKWQKEIRTDRKLV
jgi:antitoxin component of MazEF toxin-antitoxin module